MYVLHGRDEEKKVPLQSLLVSSCQTPRNGNVLSPPPSAQWSLIDWKWPSVAPGVVQLVFSLSVQFCNSSMTSFTLSQHCAPSDSS